MELSSERERSLNLSVGESKQEGGPASEMGVAWQQDESLGIGLHAGYIDKRGQVLLLGSVLF